MEEISFAAEIEKVIKEYEVRLEHQSALIFALVAKSGGEVVLTTEDLNLFPEHKNIVATAEDDKIVLKLSKEDF